MTGIMFEKIARCRLAFSGLIAGAVLLDPLQPALNPWMALMSGEVPMEPDFLGVIAIHLAYSTCVYGLVRLRPGQRATIAAATIWIDVLFSAALAFVTECKSSLFYPFFTFAIVEAGLQYGFRHTMAVTATSMLLWMMLAAVFAPRSLQLYIMRPVYLLVVGYLIGYLGEQRFILEAKVRSRQAAEQRTHIARELHDGYLQVLCAVNLQVETCRQLLRVGQQAGVDNELAELQRAINNEHDELRRFVRSLAAVEPTDRGPNGPPETEFSMRINVDGAGTLLEQVLLILREGIANILRHSQARSATIRVDGQGTELAIAIDDDGRGFRDPHERPWSIASRVRELGGVLTVASDGSPGAHLQISLPRL
jgi:signal transduction histidine kinase